METTKQKGNAFEDEVENLYKLSGYKTQRDVLINDYQTDIYAELKQGTIIFKVMIECKNYSNNRKVGTDKMGKFSGAVQIARSKGNIDRGIFVTTNGYTPEAKKIASDVKIETLTYNDLLNNLVDFDQYLDKVIRDYAGSDISGYYVDIGGKDQLGKDHKPIDEYIKDWLNKEEKNHISLLGDYGTGKTSFCKKFAHDLALQYKQNPQANRIPILVTLRDYAKAMNVRQLITDVLINEYKISIVDYSLFEKLNKSGKFLLIFDGFDEMAQKVDYDVTKKNFWELAKAVVPNSKVLLTCRTPYFRTPKEERDVLGKKEEDYIDIREKPNFEILYLLEFDDKDITDCLSKRFPAEWKTHYEQMKKIHDLPDLAKRPVMLDMIVKSLDRLQLLKKEKGKKIIINPAILYHTFTQEWLDRDFRDGRTFVKPGDKEFFMEELALQMHSTQQMSLHFSKLPERIKRHFKLDKAAEIDYFDSDIRTCSFLKRDNQGNYAFGHKSFMEFFIAQKVAREIKENKAGRVEINVEIRNFITNLLYGDYTPPRFIGNLPEGLVERDGKYINLIDSKQMVFVPAGEFIMGGEDYADEKPIRVANLDKGLFMDVTLVTNSEYKKFVDATKHKAPEYWKGGKIPVGKEEHPVVEVSWHDAVAYCKWAGKRLPKEDEWEKAARGIDGRVYPYGNEFDVRKCNTSESKIGSTTKAGSYPEGKSPYGCLDMAGNVWEWTDSWYDEEKEGRVLRGGSWGYDQVHARCSYRSYVNPDIRNDYVGFRCARTL